MRSVVHMSGVPEELMRKNMAGSGSVMVWVTLEAGTEDGPQPKKSEGKCPWGAVKGAGTEGCQPGCILSHLPRSDGGTSRREGAGKEVGHLCARFEDCFCLPHLGAK